MLKSVLLPFFEVSLFFFSSSFFDFLFITSLFTMRFATASNLLAVGNVCKLSQDFCSIILNYMQVCAACVYEYCIRWTYCVPKLNTPSSSFPFHLFSRKMHIFQHIVKSNCAYVLHSFCIYSTVLNELWNVLNCLFIYLARAVNATIS